VVTEIVLGRVVVAAMVGTVTFPTGAGGYRCLVVGINIVDESLFPTVWAYRLAAGGV
jgi:hypothetical protein